MKRSYQNSKTESSIKDKRDNSHRLVAASSSKGLYTSRNSLSILPPNDSSVMPLGKCRDVNDFKKIDRIGEGNVVKILM